MNKKWFKTASPESVGISSASIEKVIDTMCMHKGLRENHSFMIIRNKKIVAEGYFAPFKEEQHVIHSCSKAFTATAIGFAVQEGLISIDDRIAEYLPEYLPEKPHPYTLELTIRHLLIMSNGHKKKEFKRPYGEISPEQLLKDFFDDEFITKPGEKFCYDNTNSYVLSNLIKKVTGVDLIEYLRPRLFNKLGISPFYYTDDNGMFVGFGTMRLTMEELARLGQFYMDGCVWEGECLLNEEWAKIATEKHIDSGTPDGSRDWDKGYAFHMWRGKHNSFRFCGAFGQLCAVYPEYNMMFLLNSGSNEVMQEELDSFYEHILTELCDTLPESPVEYEALKSRCEALCLPACFSKPSPIISSINGKVYTISDCGEIVSAKLDFEDEICRIMLVFRNGDKFEFVVGLKDYAYTDCAKTHLVKFQPVDDAICVATGHWKQLNEFSVIAHMVPTHSMFILNFSFDVESALLDVEYGRAHEFGTK